MLTLNQIISQIKTLANAHYQIAEVGVGTIAELQGKPDRSYPLLWLSNEGGYLEDNYKVDSIRLTMFGRVITGEEGQDDDASELEVLSDMQLILLDFLNYFHQQHGQEYVTSKTATLEHFTERTNDRTAGYSTVLELKQFYDWNKCQIPESGASIPPTVDGLTLYDFCDQSVIDRLTPTQVACLEAEFGNCADATVQLNGTTVGTVASGATGDFDVLQDGSPVGSWNGSAWIIPPCSAPSLAITFYSDAGLTTPITTANYGQTVYINAVATGVTPTSYSFALTNGTKSRSFIQVGATLTWTVDIYGSVSVRASATDGSVGTSVTASSTLTVAVVKNALSLDGVNDRAVGISLVDGRSESFSVSLWVKLNNTTSPQAILSFEEPWNTNTSFYIFYGQAGGIGVVTNSIRFASYTLETSLSNHGTITPDSNYHLLVASYNYVTKDINIYWDNALIKTVAGWDFNQPAMLMYLGYIRNVAFLGIDFGAINVKDVRIHSAALSLATVQAMYADDTLMSGDEVQWLPFVEDIGTTDGQVTDIISDQKMNLNGITSPYGIVAG